MNGVEIMPMRIRTSRLETSKPTSLKVVTGVSIGAVNGACIVGAKDRADGLARLGKLWNTLQISTPFDLRIDLRNRVGAERGEAQEVPPPLDGQGRRVRVQPVDQAVDLARVTRDEAARLDYVAPRRRLQLRQAKLPARPFDLDERRGHVVAEIDRELIRKPADDVGAIGENRQVLAPRDRRHRRCVELSGAPRQRHDDEPQPHG